MNTTPRTLARSGARASDGFSLVEMLISLAILGIVMATTMTALMDAIKTNNNGVLVTEMNGSIRAAMDVVVRDLLQVGQGLPPGHVVQIPSGGAAVQVRLPGAPGEPLLQTRAGDVDMAAVVPWPGAGPEINGVRTDVVTVLEADGAFDHIRLTNLQDTQMTVALPAIFLPSPTGGADISNGGPDDVLPGQLMMLEKGSETTLVQVTAVDAGQTVFFIANDSMRLNQPGAGITGNVTALRASGTPDVLPGGPGPQVIPTTATRIRMITYYLDTVTTPLRPRLVRRINNGDPLVFDNNLGNTVAFEVTNLQVSYDLVDGGTNPSRVVMDDEDLGVGVVDPAVATGACAPAKCETHQIRMINLALTARARPTTGTRFVENTLTSQISLRSMAFVDRYN